MRSIFTTIIHDITHTLFWWIWTTMLMHFKVHWVDESFRRLRFLVFTVDSSMACNILCNSKVTGQYSWDHCPSNATPSHCTNEQGIWACLYLVCKIDERWKEVDKLTVHPIDSPTGAETFNIVWVGLRPNLRPKTTKVSRTTLLDWGVSAREYEITVFCQNYSKKWEVPLCSVSSDNSRQAKMCSALQTCTFSKIEWWELVANSQYCNPSRCRELCFECKCVWNKCAVLAQMLTVNVFKHLNPLLVSHIDSFYYWHI